MWFQDYRPARRQCKDDWQKDNDAKTCKMRAPWDDEGDAKCKAAQETTRRLNKAKSYNAFGPLRVYYCKYKQ
eukprot:6972033-Prymnesium_polylepis.1